MQVPGEKRQKRRQRQDHDFLMGYSTAPADSPIDISMCGRAYDSLFIIYALYIQYAGRLYISQFIITWPTYEICLLIIRRLTSGLHIIWVLFTIRSLLKTRILLQMPHVLLANGISTTTNVTYHEILL